VVGLLGHNGAGKTTLMKAWSAWRRPEGTLQVLGLDPHASGCSCCSRPATSPTWPSCRAGPACELITLMSGLHPRFSAERARTLLQAHQRRPERDKVKTLSKGMVVQAHLALSRPSTPG
jgi:ABC-2 type transport system ATP-binding protein